MDVMRCLDRVFFGTQPPLVCIFELGTWKRGIRLGSARRVFGMWSLDLGGPPFFPTLDDRRSGVIAIHLDSPHVCETGREAGLGWISDGSRLSPTPMRAC